MIKNKRLVLIKDHAITVTLEMQYITQIYHILTEVLTMDTGIYRSPCTNASNKNLHCVTLRAYVFVLRFMSNKA